MFLARVTPCNQKTPPSGPLRPRRSRRWLIASILAVLGVVGLALGALATVPFTSEMAHKEAVAWLSEHFESEVELKELDLRLLPLRARGKGLTVRHKGRRDVPPLISIAEFSADGGFSDLFRSHLSKLTVVGLEIQIPPKNRPSDSNDSVTRLCADDVRRGESAGRIEERA